MAADVDIREKNGSGENATVKTSGTVRFKAADNANVDLNDPIVRPGSGETYSFEKWLRLYIGSTGPSGSITDPRAYSDGSNDFGTGILCEAGVAASYSEPVDTDSTDATTDFFTYTSGSPLSLDQTGSNSGPYSQTNSDFGDYLVMQATVQDNASPGLTSSETLTIAYDET